MTGLEAISHHNGWVIAGAGAVIVFLGLSTLAFVISQLHKIIGLLDRPPKVIAPKEPEGKQSVIHTAPVCPNDISATISSFQPLFDELSPEFELADLYALANKYHLPHPHLSIRCLRDAGRLEDLGEGIFRYSPE